MKQQNKKVQARDVKAKNNIKAETVNTQKTRKLVMCAILTAFVVILQYMGSFLKFGPFSVTLVLVPIVIGAAVCGVSYATWLGFVFGVIVLATDSAPFMAINAPGTILTVLAKGTLAGLVSAFVYKLISKSNTKNKTLATVISAIVCPVVNTGIFVIGCKLFFMEALTMWGAEAGFESAGKYILYGMIGGNFIFEVVVNMILSPVIVRIIKLRK